MGQFHILILFAVLVLASILVLCLYDDVRKYMKENKKQSGKLQCTEEDPPLMADTTKPIIRVKQRADIVDGV